MVEQHLSEAEVLEAMNALIQAKRRRGYREL
jgi:predicted DNA-binding WGR domain protein